MADNTRLDPGADGELVVTREVTHAGDTSKLPGSFLVGISGTEGSYTIEAIDGTAANGIDVDVTRVSGTVTVDGSGVTQPVSHSSLAVVGGGTEAAAMRVTLANDSTGTLTVDGTVTANAGTGTFAVAGVAAENAAVSGNPVLAGGRYDASPRTLGDGDVGALRLDLSGAAYITATGLPLPTGAATGTQIATLQTTLGTKIDNTNLALNNGTKVGGIAAENAAVSGAPVLSGGRYDASPRTLDDGDAGAIALAADGAVHIDDGGNSITIDGTVTANLSATDNAVLDTINTAVVATQAAVEGTLTVGSHAVTNAGTFATQATLQAGTAEIGKLAAGVAEIGNVKNSGTFAVQSTLQTGSATIGKLAANSGVDIGDVDVLSIAAGSNLIGDVSVAPRTTGGLTMHKTISAATTNATSVKASAGQVYSIQCSNVNAAVRYLKLYNKASAPTVGTDTPVKTMAIPGNTAGAGFVISWPQGLAFGTGIAFALTTEATDAGTTGVAVNEITVNMDYK